MLQRRNRSTYAEDRSGGPFALRIAAKGNVSSTELAEQDVKAINAAQDRGPKVVPNLTIPAGYAYLARQLLSDRTNLRHN